MSARVVGIVAVAGMVAAGCADGLLVPPAESGPVEFAISLAPSAAVMGGAADAFAKTDHAVVHITAGGSAVLDTSVAIAGGGDRSVALRVPLSKSPLFLSIGVDLLAASRTLFTGVASTELARGHRTEAIVTLSPVIAALVAPDSLPTITALGDTTRVRGAAVFASGDTVASVQPTWTDHGSGVVRLQPDGGLRALTEGVDTLTATYSTFTARTLVRVRAIVTAIVFPLPSDSVIVQFGSTQQLTAVPRDRNGNALVRTPTWQSADPKVATVDTNGIVRAVGSGKTTITATIEGKTGTVRVVVPSPRIVVKPADTTLLVRDTTVLVVGDSATFSATTFDALGRLVPGVTYTWSSSDSRLLYVFPGGVASAFAEGLATVRARIGPDSGYAWVRIVRPVLSLAPLESTFRMAFGGTAGVQTVDVSNTGSGSICGLTAQVQYAVYAPTGWLTATVSGCAPSTLSLVVSAANVEPGTYYATVVVSSTTRGVKAATLPVTLTVTSPSTFGDLVPSAGGVSMATAPAARSP